MNERHAVTSDAVSSGSSEAASGGVSHGNLGYKSSFLRWLNPKGTPWGLEPGERDPELVWKFYRFLGVFFGDRRYFRVHATGWQNLPPSPCMVVSNHSGGTIIPDAWGFAYAWHHHFGVERPLHPAAHEMILSNRVTGPVLSRAGVLRADRQVALRVLKEWKRDLMVMPGGDVDVWRPHKDRYKVRFAGRLGYARIALRAGVPVVPVANAGAHDTLFVLTDGRRFAELVGLKKLARAEVFPIHLSLPWGLAVGPWPHLPLPVTLRYRFGSTVHPEDVGLRPGEEPTEQQVGEFDRRVRVAIQRELDAFRDGL